MEGVKMHGTNPRARKHVRQRQAAVARVEKRIAKAAPRPADPWTDLGTSWFARLESDGSTYGLARRVPSGDGVVYEVLDRTSGDWIPSPLAGAGYFTEIGGVTDAVPITSEEAVRLEADLAGG